jgi:aminoglycoside 6'-N-acetyltransferase
MATISFRPLNEDDFFMLWRWLAEPHVIEGWGAPLNLEGVRAKYGPRAAGMDPIQVFVIEHDGKPAGWIQWYRWADFPEYAAQLGAEPEAAGIDLAVGERSLTGTGVGSTAIWKFLQQVVFADPAIVAVVTDPQQGNGRSVRAFQKVGFYVTKTVQLPGENFTRCVVRMNRPRTGYTGRLPTVEPRGS